MNSRSALERAALVLGTFVFLIVIGEVAARLMVYQRQLSSEPRDAQGEAPDLPVLTGLRAIGKPNVRGIHNGVFFRTNRLGVRGPEYAARAPNGFFRILIAGDSVAMGSGVDEGDTYASRLGRALAGAGRGSVEVINAGLAGLNAGDVMERLSRLVEAYSPDLVVYGFTVNDIEGPTYEKLDKDEAVARLWRRAARFAESPSVLLRELWPRWVMFEERFAQTLPSEDREVDHNYFENPAAWAAVASALDRLASIADGQGICAHVLIHTHLKELEPDQHPYLRVYEKVGEAANERELGVTQSFPTFAGREPGPLWVGFLDPHPNARGHELMAEALAAGLRELPESCWAGK